MVRSFGPIRSSLACAALILLPFFPGQALAYELIWATGSTPEDTAERLQGASLLETAKREGVTDVQEIIANAQAEYKRLVSTLYSEGFFGPEIHILIDGREAAAIPPFQRITAISQIRISVDPGDAFLFGETKISPLAPETELPDSFSPGKPARLSAVQNAATTAYQAWRSAGHAKVEISGERLTADHRKNTLDAEVDLEPGPMLRFGDLSISSESYVRESRLREIMALPEGEVFDPEELDKGRKRLQRTGAFRSVTIAEAKTPNPDGTLDIDLAVTDDAPRRVAIEAELESRDGLRLATYWFHRNVFGGAERLRLEAEVSGIGAQSGGTDYILSAELKRPATFNADSDIAFRIEASRIDDPHYFVEKLEGGFVFTRVISDEFRYSAGILFQRSNVVDGFGKRQFANIGLPLSATFDKRDDKLDSKSGYFLLGTVMPFSGHKSGAPGTYLSTDLRGFVSPDTARTFTFAGRVQLGSIIGPTIQQTPPDMLFFTGGGGTVRGQPYQSNTVNVGGVTTGGLSFAALSAELRVRIRPTILTVLFYDAGFVGETSDFDGVGNWHSGAGIGLRYHTDFGPIRVDLAAPVSGGTGDGLQLYVGIGQAF